MTIARLCLGLWLAWTALPGYAADAGLVTIVEGSARVLRGTVWYRLAPGAPVQDGDLIDAGDRALVQVELTAGGTLHVVGPANLYAAALPWRNDKLDGPMEFALDRGWLKLAATAPAAVFRVRTPSVLITASEATIVTRHDGKMFELFIESGNAKVSESTRIGRDGAAYDAKVGEFWSRDADKPFTTERRAPAKFVASMPRHLTDRLANLAAKFKGQRPTLAVDREITLAEADPWLSGPYRRAFSRRLGGRLADPTFRKAVEANIAAYPDFDRVLHPEKYPAQPAAVAPGTASVPPGTGAPGLTPPAPGTSASPRASPAPPVLSPPGAAKSATTPVSPPNPNPAAPKTGPRSAMPFSLAGALPLPLGT
jgi:hypothetical protein